MSVIGRMIAAVGWQLRVFLVVVAMMAAFQFPGLPAASAFTGVGLPSACRSSSSSSIGSSVSVLSLYTEGSQLFRRTTSTSTRTSTQESLGLWMSPNDDDDGSGGGTALETVGLLAQPVVWISLYNVATTGGGLPAGPFGLIGALEGVSYLVMVGLAGSAVVALLSSKQPSATAATTPTTMSTAENLSLATLVAGLLTLAKLVGDQGCVPNAKPILDYSAYLPICNPEDTPGLFGG